MKIVVLNGSPKGDMSITMQYVHFLRKKFPQHELTILNISQRIKAIEKNERAFLQIIDEVKLSDGVLWAFPLYFLLVHSHYKRFIELISEKGAEDAFRNKYAAALSTSIHFYDHTAHNYINAICDDLRMNYVGYFSADMYDLLEERERTKLVLFAEHFFGAIENDIPTSKTFQPVTHSSFTYIPGDVVSKVDIGDKKVVILTDSDSDRTNLGGMIQRFSMCFSDKIEVINLNNVDIKGGCLGCIQCGYDNNCAYRDSDGYTEFFNSKVKTADVLIIAGTIKDRYLSSRWKLFFDRSFFNTHTPTMSKKHIGFIISGPLSQIPNLRQIMEAHFEVQRGDVVDFITDEGEDSTEIDALLQNMAERLILFASEGYMRPVTFLGVGGMKVFRDDVYGRLRFPFRADHKFYRKHGMYDFPQKEYKTRITNSMLLLLTKIPSMRKEIYTKKIKAEMIKPLRKIVETK